jgi:mono/diheme cytochrome c family protein
MSRRAGILFVIAGSAITLTGLLAAQQQAPAATNPLGATPGAIEAGQTLFNQVCQSCHGAGAQGSERGPALTGTLKNGNTDADVFRTIRHGVPGTQMVAFGSFTDAQVWGLVSFIHSAQGGAPAAAPGSTATGDVAGGEAVFFGKGACSD